MLMAEGVSRHLNPALNIWAVSQPLVQEWMRENRGPEARLRDKLAEFARAFDRLPALIVNAEKAAAWLAQKEARDVLAPARDAGQAIFGLRPWQFWVLLIALLLAVALAG
jgi:ubiquinone biosynthesis protein